MKAGIIGLGNLGTPIAENLLMKTNQLFVFNRSASKSAPLVAKGACLCHSVKELASSCDIVFSVVSNDAALKEITEGNEGIAANLKPGGIHISISTILPATAKALSQLHQQNSNHYLFRTSNPNAASKCFFQLNKNTSQSLQLAIVWS